MKIYYKLMLVALFCTNTVLMSQNTINKGPDKITATTPVNDSLLRHVVLFKFKADTSQEQISKIESAFGALPAKISQISSYEWGLNNSPEGLDKGFTHCFYLTFKSEEDRAIYLPHPEHQAFVSLLGPVLEDVLVIDYWTR